MKKYYESTIEIKEQQTRKRDNFFGDRSVVLPMKYVHLIKNNPLICDLYVFAIGYYPNAKFHYRERNKGSVHNILIYCIDGKGYITLRDKTYALSQNTYMVIPAGTPHIYWADKGSPWSIYWMHITGSKCEFIKFYFGRVIEIDDRPNARINDRINTFNEILRSYESGFSKQHIEYANLTLHHLLASFFYIEAYRAIIGVEKTDPVENAISYMQKNIYSILRLKDISDHVDLSESHFIKIFRNRTGSSPIDYFTHLKIQEAVRLLRFTSLRIREVSFKLGYEDPCYFSRLFTKHLGKSPRSFIKNKEIRDFDY
jgi:AraC-like DNA-binding protein